MLPQKSESDSQEYNEKYLKSKNINVREEADLNKLESIFDEEFEKKPIYD